MVDALDPPHGETVAAREPDRARRAPRREVQDGEDALQVAIGSLHGIEDRARDAYPEVVVAREVQRGGSRRAARRRRNARLREKLTAAVPSTSANGGHEKRRAPVRPGGVAGVGAAVAWGLVGVAGFGSAVAGGLVGVAGVGAAVAGGLVGVAGVGAAVAGGLVGVAGVRRTLIGGPLARPGRGVRARVVGGWADRRRGSCWRRIRSFVVAAV